MIIAFHSNQISRQGTEVALYDYADAAERVLQHRAVILHDASNPNNVPEAIEKFKGRFDVLAYRDRTELDVLIRSSGAKLMYAIKSGRRDGLLSQRVPTMVHAVFPTSPFEAHGASFAYISSWLSDGCSGGVIPAVPHIVQLPAGDGNLRESLGISPSALVLGGMGGAKSFNVPAAREGLRQALEQREDLWFVALNLEPFLKHPRAVFLPGTSDMAFKARFVDTCDAMLHARALGESFGLACGEFSVRNKRVIAYAHSKHRHHIEVLGDAALLYHDAPSLLALIRQLDTDSLRSGHWDRYTERYNAERVMGEFDRHLIQPALGKQPGDGPGFRLGWRHRLAYLRFKLTMKLA